MVTLLTCIHVFACIFLMLTVLLQAGKGGGMGAALGGQTSAQVFGGRGAGSFLERLTVGAAVVFMVTSMSLAYTATQQDSTRLKMRSEKEAAKAKAEQQKAADDKATKEAEDRAAKTNAPVAVPANESSEPASSDEAAKPEAAKPKAKPETKPETKTEPKPETKNDAPKADKPAKQVHAKPADDSAKPADDSAKPADEEQQ